MKVPDGSCGSAKGTEQLTFMEALEAVEIIIVYIIWENENGKK